MQNFNLGERYEDFVWFSCPLVVIYQNAEKLVLGEPPEIIQPRCGDQVLNFGD